MHLIPFVLLFPEQGEEETRTIITRNHEDLPDDQYALAEAYCTDPECDCRRVMLNILTKRHSSPLATISYGFDRDGEMAGPFLDPLNPQSRYAKALLKLVTSAVLTDSNYVARLESHYHQVKRALADPSHPVHKKLSRVEGGYMYKSGRRKSVKRRGKVSRSHLKPRRS